MSTTYVVKKASLIARRGARASLARREGASRGVEVARREGASRGVEVAKAAKAVRG